MASPPFTIDETLPGDSDIVSQHPANARTFRDVVESWLLVNHNVQGRHDRVDLDLQSTPSGTAGVLRIWADTAGYLRGLFSSGAEYVGNPPGTILDYAGTTAPNGYLLCYGQAISRTTYVTLFNLIGTDYGLGDGSTTFNIPDARGRVLAGKDNMGGTSANRLTNQTSGVDGDILGDTGGEETHILIESELASHDHNFNDPGHTHDLLARPGTSAGDARARSTISSTDNIELSDGAVSNTTGITFVANGSDAPHNNIQPTIIMNKIIKY